MSEVAPQEKPARKLAPLDDGKLRVGLAAPGVTPTTVNSLLALDTVRAYLDLVLAIGRDLDKDFDFNGLSVESGSAVLVVTPSDRARARSAISRARRMLEGRIRAPPAVDFVVNEVKRRIRALPPDHVAFSSFGRHRFQLLPREPRVWTPPEAVTTFRATLVQIGGVRNPHARFVSRFENGGDPFALRVSEDEAKRIGGALYSEMEISAQISRYPDGRIESGALLEWEVVPGDMDAFEAMRAWFQKNAREWDAVEDVEHELGRGD